MKHSVHSFTTGRSPVIIGVVAVILIAILFIGYRAVFANDDYICVKVVDTSTSQCVNGAWSDWSQGSKANDESTCQTTTVENRLYTGTRVVKQTLSYTVAAMTSCADGFQRVENTNRTGGGNASFDNGTIASDNSACQIQQTRTTKAAYSGGKCAGGGTGTGGTGGSGSGGAGSGSVDITTTQTDVGGVISQKKSASSLAELLGGVQNIQPTSLNQNTAMSIGITVKPSLLRSGDTTVVTWQSTGAVSTCAVNGSNKDQWTGLSGSQKSSAIRGKTVYTLSCSDADGNQLTASATVGVIPTYKEQ